MESRWPVLRREAAIVMRRCTRGTVAVSLEHSPEVFVRSLSLHIVVEKHRRASGEGFYYVAYPLGGIVGAVVGQGDTRAAAVQDIRSALKGHLETFGEGEVDDNYQPEEVSVEEVEIVLPVTSTVSPQRATKPKIATHTGAIRTHAAR